MDSFNEDIRRYPFVRLLLPLLTGISCQQNYPIHFNVVYGILLLFLLVILIHKSSWLSTYHLRWLWGIALFGLLFFTGIYLINIQKKNSDLPLLNEIFFTAVVTNNPQTKEHSIKINLEVDKYCDTAGIWHTVSEGIIAYTVNDSSLTMPKTGDKLLCRAAITPLNQPQNPNEFDYSAYMARRGVFASVYLKKSQFKIIDNDRLPFYREIPLLIQRFVYKCFRQVGITDNELAVITALTIGDKQYLDDSIKQSFTSAGVIHLLAVSGLHVGVIFMAINLVLSIFSSQKRLLIIFKIFFTLTTLWLYASIVGFSASVTRATLMFSFLAIAQVINKQRSTYNFIAASAFIICIINPYSIFEVSFQLSYAAVLGIVYFQPKIYKLSQSKHVVIKKIWQLASVALAAQLTTTPIVLYYFHQFPTYFLPANIVLVIFTTLLIYTAFLLLTFCWMPFVSKQLGWLLNYGIKLLNDAVQWVEALPRSLIEGVYINTAQCLLLLFALIVLAFYWTYRNPKTLILVMLLLIVVFGVRTHHISQLRQQQTITVYNTNKSTFISFIDGQQGYILRDSLHQYNYFDYQTKNHFVRQGFSSAHCLPTYSNCNSLPFSYHNFIRFGNKTLYMANNTSIEFPKISDIYIEVDYIVVSQQTKHTPANLLSFIRPMLIIIDASTPTWKAQQWIAAATAQNLNYHCIKNNGAFVYQKY